MKEFFICRHTILKTRAAWRPHTHTHTHRAKRESAHRMKKVGPTPLFLFSPFHRASLFDEGVSSAKTNRCSVREPRRGRKNSRRATRKRLLKRELCKRESFFFILPTSVFAVSRIPGFLSRKRNRRFSPFPKFFKLPPCPQEGEPLLLRKDTDRRVFFSSVPDPKSLRFVPRSFFHRTVFHKCGRGIHRSSAAGRHHQIRRRARCFLSKSHCLLVIFFGSDQKNNVFPEPQDEFSKSIAFLFGILFPSMKY